MHDLQKAGKNLSRADFLKVANDGSSYNVPGGLGDVSFPTNHEDSVSCGSLVQISGGQYQEKVPLSCFPSTTLAVLGKS